jgi:hypothetical protein
MLWYALILDMHIFIWFINGIIEWQENVIDENNIWDTAEAGARCMDITSAHVACRSAPRPGLFAVVDRHPALPIATENLGLCELLWGVKMGKCNEMQWNAMKCNEMHGELGVIWISFEVLNEQYSTIFTIRCTMYNCTTYFYALQCPKKASCLPLQKLAGWTIGRFVSISISNEISGARSRSLLISC